MRAIASAMSVWSPLSEKLNFPAESQLKTTSTALDELSSPIAAIRSARNVCNGSIIARSSGLAMSSNRFFRPSNLAYQLIKSEQAQALPKDHWPLVERAHR